MRREPALYDGLLAECYDAYLSDTDFGDTSLLRNLILETSSPALELGCGSGRLLIPFVTEGLVVEGLDNSPDMLSLCRSKADLLGVAPVLHGSDMTDFNLGKRYGLVFCAVASFTLLAEPGAMEKALAAIRRHLLPSGRVAISIDRAVPPYLVGALELKRQAIRPSDGTTLQCWLQAMPPHWANTRRYQMTNKEISSDGTLQRSETRHIDFRPMDADDFFELLTKSGFRQISLVGPKGGEFLETDESYYAIATCK